VHALYALINMLILCCVTQIRWHALGPSKAHMDAMIRQLDGEGLQGTQRDHMGAVPWNTMDPMGHELLGSQGSNWMCWVGAKEHREPWHKNLDNPSANGPSEDQCIYCLSKF
jgi:hypothetical protein